MTPPTNIALLRGINVGGHNKLPMAELRALCADIGWSNVKSYIQSGNVVFSSPAPADILETELAEGIAERFGLEIAVIVRTKAQWQAYLDANPFPGASNKEPNLVMLALASRLPTTETVARLSARADNGERVRIAGGALWAHFPGGSGRSKLTPTLLDRTIGAPVTSRNWRTVQKLADLTA